MTTTTNYCQHCNAPVYYGMKHCRYCGAEVVFLDVQTVVDDRPTLVARVVTYEEDAVVVTDTITVDGQEDEVQYIMLDLGPDVSKQRPQPPPNKKERDAFILICIMVISWMVAIMIIRGILS